MSFPGFRPTLPPAGAGGNSHEAAYLRVKLHSRESSAPATSANPAHARSALPPTTTVWALAPVANVAGPRYSVLPDKTAAIPARGFVVTRTSLTTACGLLLMMLAARSTADEASILADLATFLRMPDLKTCPQLAEHIEADPAYDRAKVSGWLHAPPRSSRSSRAGSGSRSRCEAGNLAASCCASRPTTTASDPGPSSTRCTA